jgi:hypothetical protein
MTALTVTAKNVSPLPGAIVREFIAGSAVAVGDLVFMASDGFVDPTDADNATALATIGICVAAGNEGAEAAAVGDPVSVVIFGPVIGFSGNTPGDLAYASPTAGEIEDAAPATGDYLVIVGVVISTTILLVNIWTSDLAAQT